VISVPASFQYCGLQLAAQGVRIYLLEGVPLVRCGRRLALAFGK
jgi:hypothetical protein